MIVGDAAGELPRRQFAGRVLRLTIRETLLLLLVTLSSGERLGRRAVGNPSDVRALGFQDDRLESWGGTSSRGRRG
mgnify:CR=1 FL=1